MLYKSHIMNYDFPKNSRLLTASDYQHVFKKAIKSSDKYFTIIARKGRGDKNRLGLAISKKAVKHAVQRNRIKRVVREYFRLKQQPSKPNVNLDYVVMVRKGIERVPNELIFEALDRNFSRIFQKSSRSI